MRERKRQKYRYTKLKHRDIMRESKTDNHMKGKETERQKNIQTGSQKDRQTKPIFCMTVLIFFPARISGSTSG